MRCTKRTSLWSGPVYRCVALIRQPYSAGDWFSGFNCRTGHPSMARQMKSQSLRSFEERLKEIDQLIEAHNALTRLRRAEARLQSGGQHLRNVAHVVEDLVSDPGPGRPQQVHALNSAAIALLSGHLQGYIVDVFQETAQAILRDKVKDVEALIDAAQMRGNPNERNIRSLFKAVGFHDIFDGISWQRMSTESLKKNINDFNELRNRVVHGSSESVRKQVVSNYKRVSLNFATHLDEKLRAEIRALTGAYPW